MIIPLERFWSVLTAKPCNEQQKIVEREWPSGIPLRAETIWRAWDLGLDLNWVVTYLPAPFRSEYEKNCAPLWREYNENCALFWSEYKEKHAPIWSEYDEKHAPIRREYRKKRALLLLEILRTMFQ